MTFKIVFAGTPQFAVPALEALRAAAYPIVGVYTQPDRPSGRGRQLQASPMKHLALEWQLPLYQPTRLGTPQEAATLAALEPDLMIVAAYGLILPKSILEIPTRGCINIHASLLPQYRGAAPIQQAILSGDVESGVSIMRMDEGLDTGDVILSKRCPIESDDTSASLQERLAQLGAIALIEVLEQYAHNTQRYLPQDPNRASYAPKILKSDAHIDWQEPAVLIERKIRAFNPWPIAHAYCGDQCVRLWSAKVLHQPIMPTGTPAPGTIIAQNPDSLDVLTGHGVLRILELQWPSGKRLALSELLKSKGASLAVGSQWT